MNSGVVRAGKDKKGKGCERSFNPQTSQKQNEKGCKNRRLQNPSEAQERSGCEEGGRGGGGEEQEGVLLTCCVCFVDKLCLLPIIMALGSRLSEQALSGMFAYVAERRKKR